MRPVDHIPSAKQPHQTQFPQMTHQPENCATNRPCDFPCNSPWDQRPEKVRIPPLCQQLGKATCFPRVLPPNPMFTARFPMMSLQKPNTTTRQENTHQLLCGVFSVCRWAGGAGTIRPRCLSSGETQPFSHPSTNQARPCLASEIRRDQARSGWHGRR